MAFLLDDPSLEILCMMCDYLKPDEISAFHQVSQKCAAIGLQTIPEVHFVLLPRSLERLGAISEHRSFRQHVCRLIYEGDRLPRYVDMKAWAKVAECAKGAEMPETSERVAGPCRASRRMKRVYREKACKV